MTFCNWKFRLFLSCRGLEVKRIVYMQKCIVDLNLLKNHQVVMKVWLKSVILRDLSIEHTFISHESVSLSENALHVWP